MLWAADGDTRAERLLRTIAETSPAAITIHRADTGEATFANSRWEEITGQPMDEAMGHGFLAMIHPDDTDPFVLAGAHARKTGQPYTIRYRLLRADGEQRWLDAQVGVTLGDEGDVRQRRQVFVEARGDGGVVDRGDEVGADASVEQRAQRGLHGDDDALASDVGVEQEVDVFGEGRAGGDADGGGIFRGGGEGVGGVAGGVVGEVVRDVVDGARGVVEGGRDVGAAVGKHLGEQLGEGADRCGVAA